MALRRGDRVPSSNRRRARRHRLYNDPHVQASNIDHVRAVIAGINRLEPTIVLIGGDFVTGDEEDFALQEVWSQLDAPTYAVLGNHDYRVGTNGTTGLERTLATRASATLTADGYDVSALNDGSADTAFAEELIATLEENGVHLLRNEYLRLTAGDRRSSSSDRRRLGRWPSPFGAED